MTLPSKAVAPRQNRPAAAVISGLILAFVVVVGSLSLLRYAAVQSSTDLAIYSQAIWNTAHGDPFRVSALPFTENYLGNHFTPILALFVPLYLIWADPRWLLLAQVAVTALATLPLYWFAREQLPTPWAGVLLVAAFFCYPAVQHQNLTDFHGVALGTTAVMWAYYALLTGRDRLLFCTVPLMLLIREDVLLVLVMMGLYAFLFQRRRRLGVVLFVLGAALGALVILVLIPGFRGGSGFYYTDYYDYLGDSPLDMMGTLLLHPGVWLSRVFHPPKLQLLVQILAPVAFLPLLAPSVFLLGGSALAYLLLVDLPFTHTYTLTGQNQALVIPFVFFGAVLALARLERWLAPRWTGGRVALVGSGLVLLASVASLVLWGPFADPEIRDEFRFDGQSQAEQALLARIPPDAGVVTDDRFAAPLSTREGFYLFGGTFVHPFPLDYLIYEDTPVGYWAHPPAVLGAPEAGGWQVPRYESVGSAGLTDLRRRTGAIAARELPALYRFGDMVALRGVTASGGTLPATPGQPLEVALVWESLASDLPRLVPFVHLVERRSGGEYRWASVDREVYGGLFPSNRWLPGNLVGDISTLEIPPWLPPGRYELHVGLYTRDGMKRLSLPDGGTTAFVGTADVAPPGPSAGDALPEVPIPLGLDLVEGLELYGQNPILDRAAPGAALDVVLFWEATGPLAHPYGLRFELRSETQPTAAATWNRPLVQGRLSPADWQPGAVIADWQPLTLPDDLLPDQYELLLTLWVDDRPASQPVHLSTLQVE